MGEIGLRARETRPPGLHGEKYARWPAATAPRVVIFDQPAGFRALAATWGD